METRSCHLAHVLRSVAIRVSDQATGPPHVQYVSGRLTRTAVVYVDVQHRSDLTGGTIESTLQDWADADPEKRIASFEFVEEKPGRRGERVDDGTVGGSSAANAAREIADGGTVEEGGSSVGASTIQSVPGAEPVEGTDGYAPGDHVAYVVGGTESGVYRHTTDGIIRGVPPYRRGPAGDEVREYYLLDIGEPRLKRVPIEDVVGHVGTDGVRVDNPRDLGDQH